MTEHESPARSRRGASAARSAARQSAAGDTGVPTATATTRIEKSDLVGLGIELLAAVLTADGGLAPAPDQDEPGAGRADGISDLAALRAYVRTYVRTYAPLDTTCR